MLIVGIMLVVINAEKIIMTGKKMKEEKFFLIQDILEDKKEFLHQQMLAKDPTSVVRHAIKGMLPKNKLGSAILRNCYIYAGAEHNNEAQKPQALNLNDLK